MEGITVDIKEFDLIKVDERIYEVSKVNDEMIDYIPVLYKHNDRLVFDYFDCEDTYYGYVKEVDYFLEFVTAVYRLVGKDYICIFER